MKTGIIFNRQNVLQVAGGEVIQDIYFVPSGQASLGQMAPNKPGAASNKYFFQRSLLDN